MSLLAIIGLLWIGWLLGWTHAHHTVADECERVGAFYVGSKTFRCVKTEEHSQ